MIARRFLVSGHVQGVGFRYFVINAAVKLGLAGWTRNLPDGRVEVLAQGEREAVEAMASELSVGPCAARVAAVESTEEQPDLEAKGFSVRY